MPNFITISGLIFGLIITMTSIFYSFKYTTTLTEIMLYLKNWIHLDNMLDVIITMTGWNRFPYQNGWLLLQNLGSQLEEWFSLKLKDAEVIVDSIEDLTLLIGKAMMNGMDVFMKCIHGYYDIKDIKEVMLHQIIACGQWMRMIDIVKLVLNDGWKSVDNETLNFAVEGILGSFTRVAIILTGFRLFRKSLIFAKRSILLLTRFVSSLWNFPGFHVMLNTFRRKIVRSCLRSINGLCELVILLNSFGIYSRNRTSYLTVPQLKDNASITLADDEINTLCHLKRLKIRQKEVGELATLLLSTTGRVYTVNHLERPGRTRCNTGSSIRSNSSIKSSYSFMKKDFASSTLTEISFPPDASKIVQIATGNVCSVALDEKGKVWAWGSFRLGQNRSSNNNWAFSILPTCEIIQHQPTPVPINIPDRVCCIKSGHAHFVALTVSGQIFTWGDNSFYQLGRPLAGIIYSSGYLLSQFLDRIPFLSKTTYPLFEKFYNCKFSLHPSLYHVPSDFKPNGIATGSYSTYAYDTYNRRVFANGLNNFGQLGVEVDSVDTERLAKPREIQYLSANSIVDIAAGEHHAIFVDDNGNVLVAGRNHRGQCGTGKPMKMNGIKRRYQDMALGLSTLRSCLGKVIKATTSLHGTVITSSDGTVWACGRTEYNNDLSISKLGNTNESFQFTLVHTRNPMMREDPLANRVPVIA